MKKVLLIIIAFVTSFSIQAQRSNCSVSPYPNTITQPDGSALTLYAFGNEAVNYLETAEGYTVLKNNKGVFEYAIIGLDGNLTLSGTKASNAISMFGKTNMQKHLRYSKQQTSVLIEYFQKLQEPNTFGKAGANVFPPLGNRKVVVVLMEFPDLKATINKSNFELLFNQTNYGGTGSFNDYYKRTSFGKLNVTADVYGWYMATKGYKNYGKTSSPNYYSATSELLQRAIATADSAGVDFSQYDSDNDGYVDAIMIMILHAGIGAEESSVSTSGDYIWSFRSTMNNSPTVDTKKFSAYAMFPEKRSYTSAMVGTGVMTHEFGHILDLPDLYATNYNGSGGGPEGVGNYANMAGGPWLNSEHTPCMHDAWSKIQLGWLTPTLLTTSGTYTIYKSAVDSNFAYKINTPRSSEFFLLENKQLRGQDAYLPGKGLAIWHVNTMMVGKLSTSGNNANNDTSNQGLGILQADGKRDLEKGINRGDGGDLFPGTSNNHNVSPNTIPNSNLYYKVGGVNQLSNVYISNITINPDSSITFKFGAVATASYTPSSIIGCAPFTVALDNQSVFANSYKWDFGDGNISTEKNLTHTFNSIGNYDVWLRVLDSNNVIVDSTKQTIQVLTAPRAIVSFARFGDSVVFVNNSTGATNYRWQFGAYTSSSKNLSPLNISTIQTTGIVHFTLVASNAAGCSDTTKFDIDVWKTGVAENAQNNIKISLSPNPIEQNAMLSFSTFQTEKVTIDMYNVLGEKIAVIENNVLQSGKHEYVISKNIFPSSGVYFIRINTSNQSGYIKVLNQ